MYVQGGRMQRPPVVLTDNGMVWQYSVVLDRQVLLDHFPVVQSKPPILCFDADLDVMRLIISVVG